MGSPTLTHSAEFTAVSATEAAHENMLSVAKALAMTGVELALDPELVRRAKAENARAWTSIFVNPAQFNAPGDLASYPRTLDRDLELLRSAGCDLVFLPRPEEIYRDGYRYRVTENSLSLQLEGASRAGR